MIVSLFRNNDLAVYINRNYPRAKKLPNTLAKKLKFRKNTLNMILKYHLKIVDYLNVTLNLSDGSYKVFHKPNNNVNDINTE